jgi:hypothetical protein
MLIGLGCLMPLSTIFQYIARLNQVNLPYAIICDLDLLFQGQIIYNLKKKKYS